MKKIKSLLEYILFEMYTWSVIFLFIISFFSNKNHWVTTFLLIMSIIVFAAHRLSYHHERMERSKTQKEQMPKKIDDIHREIYEIKNLMENNVKKNSNYSF
tara:strand:- start:96 stop:398 length:303 start_codon:yes stop_codon:yes gene_type:complete